MGKSSQSPATDDKKKKKSKSKDKKKQEEAVDNAAFAVDSDKNAKNVEEKSQEDEQPLVESSKDGKKRKKRELLEDVKTELEIGEEERPRKRRKNRTEFSDPRDDSSLDNQTRKALEYAFTQMNKPKKWKFSKARQNWIIRHVWSSESIPDSYFPLAIAYLAKVQGGSREKLKASAQGYIQPAEEGSNITSVVESEQQPSTQVKKVTFGALVEAKPNSGALVTPPSTATTAAASTADQMKRRAEEILKIL